MEFSLVSVQIIGVYWRIKIMSYDTEYVGPMNVAIFWDIQSCSPYVNRRFGGTFHLHLQGRKSAEQDTSVQVVARPTAVKYFKAYIRESRP
jgi:hypothetical protein